ncbi:protein of unknown function [Taphrina deformans PYCC 5710]|uniref:Uncharacterized protein n=1 Tax=Taphrina deformans (strain PYCC 5710 / ATCC 11124 / CBS 356.35 / IMI 108563 / JCM 9778 / NBRC 8474) TaxID=1097556 RepID=R4XDU1_TAPDE|nr:protein of unknown function [Taphrina deformans PYCC 5710]|eukprot:CCG81504.1 protein of unknown function [Taphrina deformans PYCC 5710]
MKRERKMNIKTAIEHYKQDLSASGIHNRIKDLKNSQKSTNMLFLQGRGRGLRHWVNLAIEHTVIPEVERREEEDKQIWRAEQRWLSSSQQTERLEESHKLRVAQYTLREDEKIKVFGDIGNDHRTTGKDVHEVGQSGFNAASLRASKIANELKGRDDDLLYEFKRLRALCQGRMQAKWRSLIEHCVIQISLVRERGQFWRYEPGRQELDAMAMESLMTYEAQRMELALETLLSTFSRSVEQKTKEYPPLRSFYQEFGPMTGSALRAAREVAVSRGIVYDNTFLKKNKLDLYASEFYDAMKEHLILLMVENELQNFAWKEGHNQIARMYTR